MKARSASTRPSISPESRSITATESAEAERSGIFAATKLAAGREQPPTGAAQLARRGQPLGPLAPARAEDLVVLAAQRQLVGRRDHVPRGDLLALVVEDRRLDRPADELVGVAAEELVERVGAGDVDREAAPLPSRPSPHLAQAGDGARGR